MLGKFSAIVSSKMFSLSSPSGRRSANVSLHLEKWPYVGNILWEQAAHIPRITRAVCSKNAFCMGCMDPSVMVG